MLDHSFSILNIIFPKVFKDLVHSVSQGVILNWIELPQCPPFFRLFKHRLWLFKVPSFPFLLHFVVLWNEFKHSCHQTFDDLTLYKVVFHLNCFDLRCFLLRNSNLFCFFFGLFHDNISKGIRFLDNGFDLHLLVLLVLCQKVNFYFNSFLFFDIIRSSVSNLLVFFNDLLKLPFQLVSNYFLKSFVSLLFLILPFLFSLLFLFNLFFFFLLQLFLLKDLFHQHFLFRSFFFPLLSHLLLKLSDLGLWSTFTHGHQTEECIPLTLCNSYFNSLQLFALPSKQFTLT